MIIKLLLCLLAFALFLIAIGGLALLANLTTGEIDRDYTELK